MALPPFSLIALLSLACFVLYKFVLYPAYLSPLSKIPNAHPTAPFSEAWILWTRHNMRNNRATLAAHRKHGPIVQMAPNELSINCVDGGIRTVYAGGFEKHDWYPRLFPSFGVINMFSTVEHQPHSAKKRLVSNIYSKSYLQSSAQLHENSLILLRHRFLPFIQEAAIAQTAVDVHDMNNGFTMDFMSAYQFGLACSTKLSIDSSAKHHYLQQYHCRKDYEFHSQEIPRVKAWCKWLGFPLVPKQIEEANDFIEEMGMRMCNKADAYLENLPSAGVEPVVYKQFKNGLAKQRQKPGEKASQEEIEQQRLEVASEMLDHLGAGQETSAIALTYLYYEMSRRADLQEQLRQELLSLSPQIVWPPTAGFELPSPKSIDALPLLHAIIMETLRLHAPIPGLEPRITPAGGCSLAGYDNIPAKVRVSAMPYALHRNAEVYPEPESWRPERWLRASEMEMKEMLRWFWAFGSGGRMCIGSNLAMQEMKLIVTAVYTNWRTVIVNDEGIEEIDAYTTRPRSNRLILRFEHVVAGTEEHPQRT